MASLPQLLRLRKRSRSPFPMCARFGHTTVGAEFISSRAWRKFRYLQAKFSHLECHRLRLRILWNGGRRGNLKRNLTLYYLASCRLNNSSRKAQRPPRWLTINRSMSITSCEAGSELPDRSGANRLDIDVVRWFVFELSLIAAF